MGFRWTGRTAGRQAARMSAAALLALALLGSPPVGAASVDAIDLADDHITLRFDEAVAGASTFLLAGPERIAIDVGGAEPGHAQATGGLVSATRHGRPAPETARIVFDLATPAVVTGGKFAPDGRSLTLSVKPVAPAVFTRSTRLARQSFAAPPGFQPAGFRAQPPTGGDRTSVRVPIEPPLAPEATPAPEISGARGTNRPLVVIDAGHGGHDPGAPGVDGKHREKEATLQIARTIRDELKASGRVRVALTRDDDRFLILGERREIARRLKADLFISIHADSAPNPAARGATIYTLSEVASDRVAAQLAARENRADVLNGVNLGGETTEVSSILLDLAQRETMNVSASFAALLQREMSPKVPFRTEFHRFAGLVVLKAPDVPSVLLETGYMSNPDDVKELFSKEYQQDIAVGVRRAVETHFARRMAKK
jgi:N-acetylmuramoyl-L-alanine amidase